MCVHKLSLQVANSLSVRKQDNQRGGKIIAPTSLSAPAPETELRQRFKPQELSGVSSAPRFNEDVNRKTKPGTEEEGSFWVVVLILLLVVMGAVIPFILSTQHFGLLLTRFAFILTQAKFLSCPTRYIRFTTSYSGLTVFAVFVQDSNARQHQDLIIADLLNRRVFRGSEHLRPSSTPFKQPLFAQEQAAMQRRETMQNVC